MQAIARGESHFREKDVKAGMGKLRAWRSARTAVCVTGILEALQWQANREDEDIIAKREEVIAALEVAAAEQKSSGLLEAWFGNCAKHIREVRALPSDSLLFVLRGACLLQVAGDSQP